MRYHWTPAIAGLSLLALLFTQPAQAASVKSAAYSSAALSPAVCQDDGSWGPTAACEAEGLAAADDPALDCYLDAILALENFVQGCIFLAYYIRDPTDVVLLIVAGLTFSLALDRYFDYLECLIEE